MERAIKGLLPGPLVQPGLTGAALGSTLASELPQLGQHIGHWLRAALGEVKSKASLGLTARGEFSEEEPGVPLEVTA